MSVTRADVIARCASPGACSIDAINDVLAKLDFDEAAFRLIARAQLELAVPPELVAATLPHMRQPSAAIALIRVAHGDRAAMLLRLLEENAFPFDLNGALLSILAVAAAVKLGTEEQRKRAAVSARLVALRCLHDPSQVVVIDGLLSIADHLGDNYLDSLLAPFKTALDEHRKSVSNLLRQGAQWLPVGQLWAALDRPVQQLGGLLDEASPLARKLDVTPPSMTKMFDAKRNEPCPCGSGKKFKRCHGPQITDQVRRTDPMRELAHVELRDAPLAELVARGPTGLDTTKLRDGLVRLTRAHQWEHAERFVDAYARRPGVMQDEVDALRIAMVQDAFLCRAFDHVKRLAAQLCTPDNIALGEVALTAIAIAERAPDALDKLLSCADTAAQDTTGFAAANLAASLGTIAPALSLLLFRGCMFAPIMYENRALLHVVDQAAARVGVLFGGTIEQEPVRVLFRAVQAADAKAQQTAQKLVEEALSQVELERVRGELVGAKQRIVDLERALEDARKELAEWASHRADPAVVRKLRADIEELQAMIRDRNAEIATLRKQQTAGHRDDDGDEREGREHGWSSIDTPEASPVTVPTWSTAARSSLSKLSPALVREAHVTVALLAAADSVAWRRVRRHDAAGVLMASLASNHRLLFRRTGELLEVLDIVTRDNVGLALRAVRAASEERRADAAV